MRKSFRASCFETVIQNITPQPQPHGTKRARYEYSYHSNPWDRWARLVSYSLTVVQVLLLVSPSSEARTGRTGLLSSGVMSEGGVTVMSVLSRVPFLSDYLLCRLFSRCAVQVQYHRTPTDTVHPGVGAAGPSHSPRLVGSYGGRDPHARLPRSDARRTHRRHRVRRPTPHR